jgi:hypothetical protein
MLMKSQADWIIANGNAPRPVKALIKPMTEFIKTSKTYLSIQAPCAFDLSKWWRFKYVCTVFGFLEGYWDSQFCWQLSLFFAAIMRPSIYGIL